MKKNIILALGLVFLPILSFAEYRAFLLEIKSADGQSKRYVKSNLDPLQYPAFYPLKQGETVAYTDTWMCDGRTSEQPICKSPKEISAELAETDADKDTAPETESARQPASAPKN